jgi:hypothetical protein
MLLKNSLLVSLIKDASVTPKRTRGRPMTYLDRLILKTLVIMIIRRL